MFANFIDSHDRGMLQPGHRFGLGSEASDFFAAGVVGIQDHFQGDIAVGSHLTSPVNHTHPAAAQFASNFVTGDREFRFVCDGIQSGCWFDKCLVGVVVRSGIGPILNDSGIGWLPRRGRSLCRAFW